MVREHGPGLLDSLYKRRSSRRNECRAVQSFALGCVLWQLLAVDVAGQTPLPATPQFDIQTWQSDQGLPRPAIDAIGQGKDGYLWVGTWDSRARFDGVSFTEYLPDKTPELAGFGISKFVSDRFGVVWHATAGGGLAKWAGGHWVRCLPEIGAGHSITEVFGVSEGAAVVVRADGHVLSWRNGRVTFDVWAGQCGEPSQKNVCRDNRGAVWFTTATGRMVRVAGSNAPVEIKLGGELRGKQWTAVATDSAGNVWAGSDRELAIWRGDRFEAVPQPQTEAAFAVEQIIPALAGRMWVAANHRLWLWRDLNVVTNVCPWPPLGVPCKVYLADHAGRLWLGTRGHGLTCIQPDCRQSLLTANDGLSGNYVSSLFEDRENNIWIGMDRAGLARLRERRFEVLGSRQGLSVPVTWTVCEDQAGRIWLGTEGGGLNLWSQGQITRFDVGWENSPGEVRSLLADQNGLWVGTSYKGLFRLESGSLTTPLDMKQIGYQVFAMCEYPSNQLWIGKQSGLYRWDRQKNIVKSYGKPDGLINLNVRAIVTNNDGQLWIGTYGGGVARLEGDRFVAYNISAGAGANNVSGLFPDPDGSLWIATIGGGLCCLRDGKVESYTSAEGLPDDRIAYVIGDGSGFLWLGSPGGIFRVSKLALAAVANRLTNRFGCLAFDKADGLPTKVCTGGSQPACWRAHDGRLWFTTDNGAVSFNPEKFKINQLPPPVLIEELRADNQIVYALGGLRASGRSKISDVQLSSQTGKSEPSVRIRPGRHVLEFHYTATSLTAPEKVRFKFRLEGLDRDWREVLNVRTAIYNDIPPGDYRFHVTGCNDDGIWNEAGTAVLLTVLPYFWQTWWFKISLAGVLLIALAAGVQVRLMRMRNFARLRLRISRDIHDEIGCNLGSIAILAQILKAENDPQGRASGDISEIQRITKATIDSLHDIIWLLDPDYDDLLNLVAKMKEVAETILRGIEWQFDETGAGNNVRIPLSFRQNALPLFKEVLNNIVKHSHATKVLIAVSNESRLFRLKISDNGIGFDPAQKHDGNGIKNYIWRSKAMGGKIDIMSQPGQGTTITFEAAMQQKRDRL